MPDGSQIDLESTPVVDLINSLDNLSNQFQFNLATSSLQTILSELALKIDAIRHNMVRAKLFLSTEQLDDISYLLYEIGILSRVATINNFYQIQKDIISCVQIAKDKVFK